MSRELPILFSAPMVLAILAGRKTQTRRLAKPRCVPGDVLYVRETFRLPEFFDSRKPSEVTIAPGEAARLVCYEADWPPGPRPGWGKTRVSLHMPRVASRIDLRVGRVWSEPLQAISEADARAEGVYPAAVYGGAVESWLPTPDMRDRFYPTAVEAYAALWDAINGPGVWAKNPTVWAVKFERVK
jgi:hypothetical protein